MWKLSLPTARSAQADQSIEKPGKGLCAVHDHIGIRAFHALGCCVEQRTRIPGTEVLVTSPFLVTTPAVTWAGLLIRCEGDW